MHAGRYEGGRFPPSCCLSIFAKLPSCLIGQLVSQGRSTCVGVFSDDVDLDWSAAGFADTWFRCFTGIGG